MAYQHQAQLHKDLYCRSGAVGETFGGISAWKIVGLLAASSPLFHLSWRGIVGWQAVLEDEGCVSWQSLRVGDEQCTNLRNPHRAHRSRCHRTASWTTTPSRRSAIWYAPRPITRVCCSSRRSRLTRHVRDDGVGVCSCWRPIPPPPPRWCYCACLPRSRAISPQAPASSPREPLRSPSGNPPAPDPAHLLPSLFPP